MSDQALCAQCIVATSYYHFVTIGLDHSTAYYRYSWSVRPSVFCCLTPDPSVAVLYHLVDVALWYGIFGSAERDSCLHMI